MFSVCNIVERSFLNLYSSSFLVDFVFADFQYFYILLQCFETRLFSVLELCFVLSFITFFVLQEFSFLDL